MSYVQSENSMTNDGYNAYTQTQNKTGDSRDVEYRLLAQVTHDLSESLKTPDDVKKRVSAALRNRDVWSALRLDLNNEYNGLPKELRASLVSLSLWIERETASVIDGTGDIEALVEVNRNIMAGLRPEKENNEEQQEEKKAPDTSQVDVMNALSTDENA
jgi:flagellar protein FlaF